MTKERPIIFSGPMVRAIIDGRKTQTRRVVKPQPTHRLIDGLAHVTRGMDPADDGAVWYDGDCIGTGREVRAPWLVGDMLWVRETWAVICEDPDATITTNRIEYKADTGATNPGGWDAAPDDAEAIRWRSPIHMPRWACRLTLRVDSVRVERLNDISEEDAIAEGMVYFDGRNYEAGGWHSGKTDHGYFPTAVDAYSDLWDRINGNRHPWASNPWVWVVTFARL